MSRLPLSEVNIFFVFLIKSSVSPCICFHCSLTVQGWIKEEKFLEEVGKVHRASKESLTPFQRVSQSLAIKKPHL